jgi:XRE family transcriptional regulator of biofilm formation
MIGKRVQQLRLEKELPLSELAERAGVAKSYLSTIERDIQSNPSIQFLEKIETVFGVPVDSLLHPNSEVNEEKIDPEWREIIQQAMESGVSKEEFKEFLEFNIWRNRTKK